MLKKIINFILPWTCLLCHDKADDMDLCQGCYQDLPWLSTYCEQCALPLPRAHSICGKCQITRPWFDRTIALFHYNDPIKNMLSRFKFYHQLAYGRLFSMLLLKKLESYYKYEAKPDLVIPVPLHPSRLRQRGYNQALELTRALKKLSLRVQSQFLKRVRLTVPQSSLESHERLHNVNNAFTVNARDIPVHIALVDDVITTGSTVNECSRILKKKGVKQITVLSIARTSI